MRPPRRLRIPFVSTNRFVRDALTLVVGTAGGQGIAILAAPVLTRLYTPEQFGVFSLYLVVLSIVSVIVCLGYEPAIVLPASGREASRMLTACVTIACATAALSLVGVGVLGQRLAGLLKAPELVALLWWTPVNIVAVGTYQALSYWNTRGKRFKRMSLSRLCQSGTTAAGQIAGGAMGGGATGLVAGQVAGQLAACAVLATSTRTGPAPPQGHGASRSTPYLELLHRYRKFPLYSTWGTLMNAAAFQCVPVVLFSLFGSAVTGFYSLAFRLVGAPMALIGSALGNVLLQRVAAQLARERDVSSLVAKVIGRSILVFAPAFILLALVAPPVFPFLLGPEWGTSGRYVQIMALLFLMQLVVSPASVVLIALQKQHVVGAIQGLLLVGAVTSLVVSGRLSGNPNVSLGVYTASQSAIYLLYLYAIVRYSGTSVSAIARECSWRRGPSRGMRGEA